MSSFTDNSLPQFSPYTPQLPVEAMAQVGMQRQQMYNQGVQKIQSQIDNVAGLDLYRDVDKNYLQSKLNELGNKLTTVAAGDFSNFQLVNSVSGMTNQLIKDKNVQNAVQSTSHIRKQQSEIEKATKEGKSSIANQWDFNQQLGQYVNSTEVGQVFNGRYTPYIDLGKKAQEVIKGLHPKLSQYDIPFEIGEDGKINTRKIADAMKRYKVEGIDESQIQQALAASMTPDDYNQMSIDGRYRFKDVSPLQLAQKAVQENTNTTIQYQATLDYLKKQQAITSDPTAYSKLTNQIDYYEQALGKEGTPGLLQEKLKQNLDLINKNPDAVKTSLYKDGFVQEYANAFSWKNQTEEYLKSPLKEQENFVADMRFKQQQENRRIYEFNKNYQQRDRELEMKAQENALKHAEVYGIESPWTTVAKDNTTLQNEAEKMFATMVTDVDNKIKNEYSAIKNNSQADLTDSQINEMVNDYAANGNKATKIPSAFLSNVQTILKERNYLQGLQEKGAQLKKEAYSTVDPRKIQEINSIGSIKAFKAGDKLGTGTAKTFSPEEMISLIEDGKASIQKDATGGLQFITADGFNAGYFTALGFTTNKEDANKKEILTKVRDLAYGENPINKAHQLYKSKLAPIVSTYIPQIKALPADKNGSPSAITINKVSSLLTRAGVEKLGQEGFDLSTASEYLSEKKQKDTRIFIQQSGDDYELQIKNESDPTKIQRIKLTKAEVQANFGNNYVNNITEESVRLNMGRGNTNINSQPNRAMMQKVFGDFPKVNKLNVVADLQRDASNPDLYVPYLGIKGNDGTFHIFEISGNDKLSRVGFTDGRNNLNSLTDGQILAIIKQTYPNFDLSKLEQ